MYIIVSSRASLNDDDDSRGAWGQENMKMTVISMGQIRMMTVRSMGASKGWQLIARGDSHHSSRLHLQLCSDVNSVNWL